MPGVAPFLATLVFAAAFGTGGDSYTVQPGDTLTSIAGQTGVSTTELARANDIVDPNVITAGQVLEVPAPVVAPKVSTYTVRSGDTLTAIATRMGISAADLARANGIADPNLIRIGQVLTMPGGAATREISAYSQLGTWVDVFDYAPAFAGGSGAAPQLTPSSVDAMAAAGIRTLYIQAAIDSPRASGVLESPTVLGAFLTRAHARGMQVVGWYLPTFTDVNADLQRLRAIRDYRVGEQGFDGVAVDIEWTAGIPNTARRNAALIDLSRRFRAETGIAIGAIVLPPVLLEVVNTEYWPSFPWKSVAPYYDVWLPMAYWTDRTEASGYRDPQRNTAENIARLRSDLGQPNAPVHVIGGIGGSSTADEYRRFVTAARAGKAVGISLYDYRISGSAVWSILARK